MNRKTRFLVPYIAMSAATGILAACSYFRVSGYDAQRNSGPEKTGPVATVGAASPSQLLPEDQEPFQISTSNVSASPANFSKDDLQSLFYADLGPADIDVSAYPEQQKANYALFQKKCSQCHTLARTVNSPSVSYQIWYYYIFKMRLRSKFNPGTGYTKEEGKRILDFIIYDAKIRKIQNRESFEMITRKLQKRFARTIEERLRRLQGRNPRLLPSR